MSAKHWYEAMRKRQERCGALYRQGDVLRFCEGSRASGLMGMFDLPDGMALRVAKVIKRDPEAEGLSESDSLYMFELEPDVGHGTLSEIELVASFELVGRDEGEVKDFLAETEGRCHSNLPM